MNRVSSVSLFGPIACLLLLGRGASAQEPESVAPKADFPLVGEISAERVNLRTGPSLGYRVLRKLQPGEKLVVDAEEGEWFRVRVPAGFTGYILGRLLEVQDDGGAVVKEDRVNLRPTPSTEYFPAGQVKKGEHLTVLAHSGDWVQVVAPPDLQAWVNKGFVRLLGTESEYRTELADLAAGARKALVAHKGKGEDAVQEALRVEIEGTFRKAEALYGNAAEEGEETADFSGAADLYRQVAEQSLLPDLAGTARARLEAIERFRFLQESLADARKIQAGLEKDLVSAKEKYQEELERIRSAREAAPPVRPARDYDVGWVVRHTPLNPFDSSQPRYKLIKGGRVLCHLESRKYDLRDFLDHQVLVSGDTATDPDTKLRILYVRRLEILGKR